MSDRANLPLRLIRHGMRLACFQALALAVAAAESTNSVAPVLVAPSLPSAGASLLRVFGALALVIGLFLAGAWLFRNAQHLRLRQGRPPKLNVLESRSLGGRHALYVVGYENERLLVSCSPAGISLLTRLEPAAEDAPEPARDDGRGMSFGEALARVLKTSLSKPPQPPAGETPDRSRGTR